MTVDNALRRNKIAGIAAEHFRDEISRGAAQVQKAYPGRPVHVGAELAIASLNGVLAALAGETDARTIGIDPFSVPAMGLAVLTTPSKPEGNTL